MAVQFDLTNMTNINDLLSEFVMMWVLIDPIGTIPVFLAATGGYLVQYRTEIAIRAVVLAGVILIFFIIGGQILLQALGISLPSFQIAGSVVLFLFALTMIFGEPKSEVEVAEAASVEHVRRVAVYPLAIPSIASPGAMLGAVLLNDSPHFLLGEHLTSVATTVVVLVATLVLLLAAGRVYKLIGELGVSVLGRIMGLILAAVAVNNMLDAISTLFKLGWE